MNDKPTNIIASEQIAPEIIAIEQITPIEQLELDKLKEESKLRRLADEEANRKLFLGMKYRWDCEC